MAVWKELCLVENLVASLVAQWVVLRAVCLGASMAASTADVMACLWVGRTVDYLAGYLAVCSAWLRVA